MFQYEYAYRNVCGNEFWGFLLKDGEIVSCDGKGTLETLLFLCCRNKGWRSGSLQSQELKICTLYCDGWSKTTSTREGNIWIKTHRHIVTGKEGIRYTRRFMKDKKQAGVMPIHQPKSEAGVPVVTELQLQVTTKKHWWEDWSWISFWSLAWVDHVWWARPSTPWSSVVLVTD